MAKTVTCTKCGKQFMSFADEDTECMACLPDEEPSNAASF